jgi:hypothetical protein
MGYENIVLRKRNMTMVDGYFYSIDEEQDALIVKTDDGTQAYSYPLDTTLTYPITCLEYDGRNFWSLENPGGTTYTSTIRRWCIENYVLKQKDIFILTAITYTVTTGLATTEALGAAAIVGGIPAMSSNIYYAPGAHPTYPAGGWVWIKTVQNVPTFTDPSYVSYPRSYSSADHRFDANVMSVEHYHIKFREDLYAGFSELPVTTDITYYTTLVSGIGAGYVTKSAFNLEDVLTGGVVTLGPNRNGQIEEHSVISVDSNSIFINGNTTYDYKIGDPISFYTKVWLFNNYDGTSNATGALYQVDAYTGSLIVPHFPGGAYKDIQAATFYDMMPTFDTPSNSICYIKATNLIFLDPTNFGSSFGSMTLDNLISTQDQVIPIYAITIEGKNVYRLQQKATYYGTTYTFTPANTYSYQLSTLQPFITSISLRANPAIVPANGVNQSTITAIVKDQFNNPIEAKPVTFTDDDPNGAILTATNNTDAHGVASTQYKAGTTAREVKITATAQQG